MRVAFASCSNTYSQVQQPIWGIIQHQQPDLLLLLGDNVYIGKEGYYPPIEVLTTRLDTQKAILKAKYDALKKEHHFDELLDKVKMLAVWDNHDFGLPGQDYDNDNVPKYGAEVSEDFRNMSRELFDEYIKSRSIKPNSKEVYCSKIIDKIKFIMLDVRSYQTDPDQINKIPPGSPGYTTLLGADQEEWLIGELLEKDAEIKVICSGMGYSEGKAKWLQYPHWVKIFKEAVLKTPKLLFLGGNIHKNEFNTLKFSDVDSSKNVGSIKNDDDRIPDIPVISRTFYEVISSGVGRNMKSKIVSPGIGYKLRSANADDDPSDDDGEDRTDMPAFNNYGIIDFTSSEVIISLYGQRQRDLHYAVIDRNDWTLKGQWKMLPVVQK